MHECVLCVHVRVRARAFVCVSLYAVSYYPKAHLSGKTGRPTYSGAYLSAALLLG